MTIRQALRRWYRFLWVVQLEDLPAVIGSPSSNIFVQCMRFNTHGLIVCVCSLTG